MPTPLTSQPTEIKLCDTARLIFVEQFIAPPEAKRLFDFYLKSISWEQSTITLYGKKVLIPRLNAWCGDHGYSYSGKTFAAASWPSGLQSLKKRIEDEFGLTLNSALANLYRDGNDGMGWHSDNEATLGANPQIASLSLGGSRRFLIRNKQDSSRKHELQLNAGSLLLMLGTCQQHWQHSIPKTTRARAPRINFTFRFVTQ